MQCKPLNGKVPCYGTYLLKLRNIGKFFRSGFLLFDADSVVPLCHVLKNKVSKKP